MFVLSVQVFQVVITSAHYEFRFSAEESITLGLRCAEVLIKKGVKVTVLEGRDRVGGRVGTTLME